MQRVVGAATIAEIRIFAMTIVKMIVNTSVITPVNICFLASPSLFLSFLNLIQMNTPPKINNKADTQIEIMVSTVITTKI